MNPNALELKNNLKELAEKIRSYRKETKEFQRKHNGSCNGMQWRLNRLAYEFRHKHIAYCELGGTPREKIENPNEDNMPNEDLILAIKKQCMEEVA